jgi:cell division protein FtsB
MPSLQSLQQRLAALEAQIVGLKQEGHYLIGVRLERSAAGGTASQSAKEDLKYARLRAGRGKLLPNGKKSMYVPVRDIARYEAACCRGEQIQKLERERNQLQAQIAKLEPSPYHSLKDGKRPRFVRQQNSKHPETPSTAIVEVVPPPVPIAPAAILVLYRQQANAPVHAVAAEVWQGNQQIAVVPPVHCLGLKGDRVSAYIKDVLASLTQQFGVTRFEDVIKELPVARCPINPCPLQG